MIASCARLHMISRRSLSALLVGIVSPMLFVSDPGATLAKPLKVETSGGLVAEIMNFAAERARQQGIDVQVVEFSDWVTPNEARWRMAISNQTVPAHSVSQCSH
jgi:ABC-type metal ion transport system substrate-binding protein